MILYCFYFVSLLATKAALEPDVALWVGLSVALVVIVAFAIVGVIMLKILRRKHSGHSPMFPVGASGTVSNHCSMKSIRNRAVRNCTRYSVVFQSVSHGLSFVIIYPSACVRML
jgi:hypothetical protein